MVPLADWLYQGPSEADIGGESTVWAHAPSQCYHVIRPKSRLAGLIPHSPPKTTLHGQDRQTSNRTMEKETIKNSKSELRRRCTFTAA